MVVVVVVYISGSFVGVASERSADWPVDVTVVEQLLLFMVVGSQIANDLTREIRSYGGRQFAPTEGRQERRKEGWGRMERDMI